MGDKETEVKKQQPHEMHNSELVSKLMAATPSYFFTPPQAGHNFFFSELLRSIVQKRKADELTSAMKAKTVPKKVRKPNNYYQKPYEPDWKRQKLNETHVKVASNVNENDDPKIMSPNLENSQDSVINVDKDDSPPAPAVMANSIVPQPNPSAFYPYVDPLHFFIDLRVSAGQAGQVSDRKKEAYLSQALKNNNNWNNPIIGKNRVGSAFKVPNSQETSSFSAINLIASNNSSSSTTELSPKFYPKHQSGSESPGDRNDEDVEIFENEDQAN